MNMMAKLFCVVCMVLCAACDSGTTSENGDGNTVGVPGKDYDDSNVKDVTIGSNDYIIHKFVGENDRITRETAVQDVNYYLYKAESYIKGLPNGFNKPEKFQTLISSLKNTNNYNVDGYDGARKLDTIINAFKPCETILKDIITNLGNYGDAKQNYLEREAFECCYRVLANEAYYEAYGADRNMVKNAYENEKNKLIAGWSQEENKFLTANLISAYNDKNFKLITSNIDSLLKKAAPKMGVTTADLRKVVNIALAGESLRAMHSLTKNLLDHKQETINYGPTLEMQRQKQTLKYEDQNKYESMSLGL
ncbi:MAG: hypothetical protein HDR38_06380 [Treponema sp.]|nr:hypothetical protein [Treponema sp.]